MANIAQSANVLSPILTHKDGHVKQTIFPVVKLFRHYMLGHTVQTHVACSEYEGPTKPEWIRGTIETPWLDVSAAVDEQGMLNLAVVNVSEDKDFETSIAGDSGIDKVGEVEVLRVNAETIGVKNTKEGEPIKIEKSSVKPDGKKVVFPKHSLTLLRWKAQS